MKRTEVLKYSAFNQLPNSASGNYAVLLVCAPTILLSFSRQKMLHCVWRIGGKVLTGEKWIVRRHKEFHIRLVRGRTRDSRTRSQRQFHWTLARMDIMNRNHLKLILYKQNQQDALSVCIYSTIFVQLYMFRTTISFIIRSSWFTVSAVLYKPNLTCLTWHVRLGLYSTADTVNHEFLIMNEMVVRNM